MHILVVEDERILCETIARSLKRLAYSVDCCYDGITAMQMLADDNFDLVVLDLNLPDADGMTVLRTLRKTDRDTKVLILSARSEVSDKVDGQNDVVLTCGDVSFDTKSRKAIVGGEPLPLTRKETGILEYLMVNRGRPISQEEFIEHVWDNSVDNFSNSIRVHISALRKKLRTSLGYDPIRNRIGEGYVMGEEE